MLSSGIMQQFVDILKKTKKCLRIMFLVLSPIDIVPSVLELVLF